MLGGYCSILLMSCSITSGALGSPDLLSYDNIGIANQHHTNNNPKSF